MRMLFSTVGLTGHVHALVPLARAARRAGHTVAVATDRTGAARVRAAGLTALDAGPSPTHADGGRLVDAVDAVARDGFFLDLAAAFLPGLADATHRWAPHVLVAERAELAAPVVAAERGTPLVRVHWGVPGAPEHAPGVPVPSVAGPRPGARPAHVLSAWPASTWGAGVDGVTAVDLPTYDGPPGRTVLPEPARPRVALTWGTVVPRSAAPPGRAALLDLVGRLDAAGLEIVLAVDDDLAAALAPLPPPVVHAGRVPLGPLLAGCAALVHHGGHGTTLAAAASAVPQVVLPCFDDQLDNADAVAKSGAGLRLLPEEAGPTRVAAAVAQVRADPAHRHGARSLAADLDTRTPVARVLRTIERTVHHRGGTAR